MFDLVYGIQFDDAICMININRQNTTTDKTSKGCQDIGVREMLFFSDQQRYLD